MRSEKLNISGFDPRIWIKSIRSWIPYLGSEAKSLQAHNEKGKNETAEKKPVITTFLEKIRSAHYGQTQFPDKETTGTRASIAVEPEQKIETPAAAAVKSKQKIEGPAAVKPERKVEIPLKKASVPENVVKEGNTFLENMQAVAEEYLGAEPENTEFDIGADGNITRTGWTFEQNLDAMQRALNGKGSGAGRIITENVTRADASAEENMAAISNLYHGTGPEKLELQNDNITDPKKDIRENLDAMIEVFPDIKVRQSPNIIQEKKPIVPRRIKGIHY